MNIEWAKRQWEIGVIEPEYIEFLKHEYLEILLNATETPTATALTAYAGYLNHIKINSDNYPLFLDVLAANNAAAVDVLLDGREPETYLNVVVPNHFIIRTFFHLLDENRRNEVYSRVLEVIVGFFLKVYRSSEEGYQLYKPSIGDVNALGKYLDEAKDQDDPLNRVILNVLLYFSKLDRDHETDQQKLDIARQASRIRSDYFDNTRSLYDSLTEETLKASESPTFGVPPEYFYGKRPG